MGEGYNSCTFEKYAVFPFRRYFFCSHNFSEDSRCHEKRGALRRKEDDGNECTKEKEEIKA